MHNILHILHKILCIRLDLACVLTYALNYSHFRRFFPHLYFQNFKPGPISGLPNRQTIGKVGHIG